MRFVGGDGAFAEDHPGVATAGEVDYGSGDGARKLSVVSRATLIQRITSFEGCATVEAMFV